MAELMRNQPYHRVMLHHKVVIMLSHSMKNLHEQLLIHQITPQKILCSICVTIGKVVGGVEHVMTLYPLYGLGCPSPILGTSSGGQAFFFSEACIVEDNLESTVAHEHGHRRHPPHPSSDGSLSLLQCPYL
jgi:hypothetical protein